MTPPPPGMPPQPSPGVRRAASGIAGAFLLARGRADGMALIDQSPAGAWASFSAMWLCAPGYAATRLLAGGPAGDDPIRVLLAEAIGYVIGWFAFPLLMAGVTDAMGRRERFPGFVAAWNWANVVQVLVMLGAATVSAVGLLPARLADLLALAALAYLLWIEWFVARTALAVPGPRAAAIVVADLVLGLFITGLTLTMARG